MDELLDDARGLAASAIERMEAQDIRDAAEKAWITTKRAADALALARTGEEPRTSGQRARQMRVLRRDDAFIDLYREYFSRQAELRGNCAYDGNCEPIEAIEAQIRETNAFIEECQRRAVGP